MRMEGLDREILSILDMHHRVNAAREDDARTQWRSFTSKLLADRKYAINLGILGKYAALRDAYASIDKAIEHSSAHLSAKVNVEWIDTTDITEANVDQHLGRKYDAVIVPGGFGDRGTEGKIACVRHVREQRIPFLGICLGFQMAVIEYARSVLGIEGANSTEFDEACPEPVISVLPEQKEIEGLGGTMRLGAQDVLIEPDTLACMLFDHESRVHERFRHRFEVDPRYIDRLQDAGLIFSGRHPKHPIMQVLELPVHVHPYFVAGQFHPELTSRPLAPQPMFMGLVAAGIAHAHPAEARDAISTRWLPRIDKPTGCGV
jgi:CTP synthase